MSEKKIDWIALKTEYAREKISLSEFAKKHDISYSTLIKRARKEKWDEERSNYGQIVVKKIYNRMSNADAKKFAKYEKALDRLFEAIYKSLDPELKELYKYRVSVDGQPNSTIELDQLNTGHLTELLKVLKEVERQMSALRGILPMEKQKEYELELKRIEAEMQAVNEENSAGSSTISIKGGTDEYAQ
ncbi:MAG: hypothetical protein E7591_00880 [Ruminococcaceae bacterium]|nr:hypothetical protein [Oscillospiraceae bacterium]